MDVTVAARRIPGALAFMAELHEFAVACAALDLDDELTLRRRQRDEPRLTASAAEEPLVKAL